MIRSFRRIICARALKPLAGACLLQFLLTFSAIPPAAELTALSPVPTAEAQEISPGCDRDEDGFIKDSGKCVRSYPNAVIDCDDGDANVTDQCTAADEVTLDVTYQFGEAISTIRATGTLECSAQGCEFASSFVQSGALFRLPSELMQLLRLTSWRGTALDPDNCFSFPLSDTESFGWASVRRVVLRQYGPETPWFSSVGTRALDVTGIQERKYIFNFEGCGATSCGEFATESVTGNWYGGSLLRIDSHENDNRLGTVPCRCTKSSTPDCPDNVGVDLPTAVISVEEVLLP